MPRRGQNRQRVSRGGGNGRGNLAGDRDGYIPVDVLEVHLGKILLPNFSKNSFWNEPF